MAISAAFTISVSLLLVVLVTIMFQNFMDSPGKFASNAAASAAAGSLRLDDRGRSSLPIVQLKSKFTASDSNTSDASAGDRRSFNRTINQTGLTEKLRGGNQVAAGLARARAAIRLASAKRSLDVNDSDFASSIYRNPQMFYRDKDYANKLERENKSFRFHVFVKRDVSSNDHEDSYTIRS